MSAIRKLWQYVKSKQQESDLALLLVTPYFIPKKLLRDLLRAEVPDPRAGTVVDVGCGDTPYQGFFRSARYIGLDLAPERQPMIVARAENAPLASGSADVVLCTEVVEHTADPGRVCRETARLLKWGGVLVLTAPMSWNLHYEPHDYFRFTPYGLSHLVRSAGLDVTGVRRVGGLFSLLGSRLVDVVHRRILALPRIGSAPGIRAAATLALVPWSALFFFVGRLLDGIDDSDAIGWLITARKNAPRGDKG